MTALKTFLVECCMIKTNCKHIYKNKTYEFYIYYISFLIIELIRPLWLDWISFKIFHVISKTQAYFQFTAKL